MLTMENKSEEKEKTKGIRMEPHDRNDSPDRPRNFSLRRRSDVYYFSDDSERGILKRIPLKNGAYEINELETVLDKSDAEKTRTLMWLDVPLNSVDNSKANKSSSANKYDDVFQSAYHDQRRETVPKSREKNARYIPQSHGLNNVEGLRAYKNNSKTKDECQDTMMSNNRVQEENIFMKSCKGIKKQQRNAFVEIDSENLQGSNSDKKYKNFSAIDKTNGSSKKLEELERNNENLIDGLTVKCLSDALSKILMETPITEL